MTGRDSGELPEVVTPQNLGRIWASSMGLSFAVPGDVDALRSPPTGAGTPSGRSTTRTADKAGASGPASRSSRPGVRLDGEAAHRIPLDGDDPETRRACCSRSTCGRATDRRVVELDADQRAGGAANATRTPRGCSSRQVHRHRPRRRSARLPPHRRPARRRAPVGDDPEEAHLRLLYRDQRRYAAGRNVAVHADGPRRRALRAPAGRRPGCRCTTCRPRSPRSARAARCRASSCPWTCSPTPTPPRCGRGLRSAGRRLRRAGWTTGTAEVADLPEQLRRPPSAPSYDAARTPRADPRRHRPAHRPGAARPRRRARRPSGSPTGRWPCSAGTPPSPGCARSRDSTYRGATKRYAAGARRRRWRPFQLAFVLLNLPSLTDPAHPRARRRPSSPRRPAVLPDRWRQDRGIPRARPLTPSRSGACRALGSGADARSGEAGVAVLMRYTLRLLTAQQFQRAAALVCASEVLRREDDGPTLGDRAVPDRAVGGHRRLTELVRRGRGADRRSPGDRQRQARQRPADPHLPLVRQRR